MDFILVDHQKQPRGLDLGTLRHRHQIRLSLLCELVDPVSKNDHFPLKTRNCVSKTRNFVFKTMILQKHVRLRRDRQANDRLDGPRAGTNHIGYWVDEATSQAEWDAWGYFLQSKSPPPPPPSPKPAPAPPAPPKPTPPPPAPHPHPHGGCTIHHTIACYNDSDWSSGEPGLVLPAYQASVHGKIFHSYIVYTCRRLIILSLSLQLRSRWRAARPRVMPRSSLLRVW